MMQRIRIHSINKVPMWKEAERHKPELVGARNREYGKEKTPRRYANRKIRACERTGYIAVLKARGPRHRDLVTQKKKKGGRENTGNRNEPQKPFQRDWAK